MALNIPESLANLEANSGVFAVWMVLKHYGVQIDIAELIKVCRYEQDGTYTIALAVALKKFCFDVSFYSDKDPNISPSERMSYKEQMMFENTDRACFELSRHSRSNSKWANGNRVLRH